MYSPNLSAWEFNKMFGLGDKEHNRRVRELRHSRRAGGEISIDAEDFRKELEKHLSAQI